MNFETLFTHLEKLSEDNKNKYKDLCDILYFNNEDFLENPDFLNVNNQKNELFEIKLKNLDNILIQNKSINDDFQLFSDNIQHIFKINETFNISSEYDSIIDCILQILNYNGINGKTELFQKMIRDFDCLKLYKKFNFQKRKICKKNEIRNLLLSHDDNNQVMFHFIVHYLLINMIIIENNKYTLFSENDIFEPFKTTIIIYKHNNKYYFLSKKIDNKKLFTSDDDIVMKIYELTENEESDNDSDLEILELQDLVTNFSLDEVKKSNLIEEKVENILLDNENKNISIDQIFQQTISIEKTDTLKDYKKMKVNELKKLCKEKGIKGYSKLKKDQLIELLN